MASEQIIYLSFRIINTAILFAVFFQTFRRFGYPWLKEQVLAQLRQLADLKEKINGLKRTNNTCAQTMVAKKHEAGLLLHKVKSWRSYVDKERERYAYECAMRAQIIQTIRKEQEEQFALNNMQRALGNRVLVAARALLVDEYTRNPKQGERLINVLCKELAHD